MFQHPQAYLVHHADDQAQNPWSVIGIVALAFALIGALAQWVGRTAIGVLLPPAF